MSLDYPGHSKFCAQGYAASLPEEPDGLIRVVNRDTGKVVAYVPDGPEHIELMTLIEGHPHKCVQ